MSDTHDEARKALAESKMCALFASMFPMNSDDIEAIADLVASQDAQIAAMREAAIAFEAAIRADEREKCASLIEPVAVNELYRSIPFFHKNGGNSIWDSPAVRAVECSAAAIRAMKGEDDE